MEYKVLARTYRPTNFDDLIGQDVLVKTLSNAIATGRIAHAFLLTGIRGVGKTTTARIIARALNCENIKGGGGPTISPCGVCTHCTMIAEDRHMDVLEMDAASNTGVESIRELIDTVRYLPSSARYKIYIIDEVHMLSNSAFNALLKTLEEPPPHVKFVFATTEARKIPVTILSRCQRFDLKRVDMETLAAHLGKIAAKENVAINEDALKLIALVAEGSVRDALSLLDQAIARVSDGNAIAASDIRQMIGSADNTVTFRLLTALLEGNIAAALELAAGHYHAGADPLLMVQDALEVTHLITRAKVAPAVLSDVSLPEHDRAQAKKLADAVSMAVITRLWQMLLKGVQEIRMAPMPMAAFEMLLVRIAYASQLPTPAEVIRQGGSQPNPVPAREAPHSGAGEGAKTTATKPTLELVSAKPATAQPKNFAELVALFATQREALLYSKLKHEIGLVSFAEGQLEIHAFTPQPREFAGRVSECLSNWTGQPWKVTMSDQPGAPSLDDQEKLRKEEQVKTISAHPLVASALEQFPGAKVVGVKTEQ